MKLINLISFLVFRSLFYAFIGLMFGIFYELFARFDFGRDLLLKYSRQATFGFCSHEGPTDKFLDDTTFSLTFYGCGWSAKTKVNEETNQYDVSPNVNVVTKVTGPNPSK